MNEDISGICFLKIKPLHSLPVYKNKENTIAKIFPKSLLKTNTDLAQNFKDYTDSFNTIRSGKTYSPFTS